MENKTLPIKDNLILWGEIKIGDNFFIKVPTVEDKDSFTYNFTTLGLTDAMTNIEIQVYYANNAKTSSDMKMDVGYFINKKGNAEWYLTLGIVGNYFDHKKSVENGKDLWKQTFTKKTGTCNIQRLIDFKFNRVVIYINDGNNRICLNGLNNENNNSYIELKVVDAICIHGTQKSE